jgi:hypothetical protein
MTSKLTLRIVTIGAISTGWGCGALPEPSEQGGNEPGSPVPALTTTAIRTLEPGDSWTYQEHGTYGYQAYSFEYEGEITNTVRTETVLDYTGTRVRVIATTDAIRFLDDNELLPSTERKIYFSQDADGSLYSHGEYDDRVNPAVQRFVTQPECGRDLIMPSPLVPGAAPVSVSTAFDDGTEKSGRIAVVGTETVTVAAGEFAAIKVRTSGTRISGPVKTSYVTTSWYVPALGAEVKYESTETTQDFELSETYTLTAERELLSTTVHLTH